MHQRQALDLHIGLAQTAGQFGQYLGRDMRVFVDQGDKVIAAASKQLGRFGGGYVYRTALPCGEIHWP